MPDDHRPSYWELKRLYAYVLPPILAVWGAYSAIKMEFHFGDYHLEGAKAVLAGAGMIVVGALVLALLAIRDSLFSRR